MSRKTRNELQKLPLFLREKKKKKRKKEKKKKVINGSIRRVGEIR